MTRQVCERTWRAPWPMVPNWYSNRCFEDQSSCMDWIVHKGQSSSKIPCSFTVWLRKIDSKLSSGEFFALRTSLMTQCLPCGRICQLRTAMMLCQWLMAGFYQDTASDGKPVWTTTNPLRLVKYIPLADVGKLRCCYLAAKRDPSVFVFDDGTNSRCPPPPSSSNGVQKEKKVIVAVR